MKKHVGLWMIGIVTALAVIYVGTAIFFQSHFNLGTTIDGIKVGGYSVNRVEDAIREEIDGYSLKLLEREGDSETVSGGSIAITPVFNGEVKQLLEQQNGFAWLATAIKKQDLELTKVVSYDAKKLKAVLESLNCMQTQNQREPVNAGYSAYSEEKGYELVPADYGTTIDFSTFENKVAEAIVVLADEVDLEQEQCYKDPEITDENEQLLALIDEMNRYTQMSITYDFGDDKEILDGTTVSTWISEDDNRKVVLDREAALAFLKELASEYNTAYKPKTLKTSYGTEITISGGPYGWKIDYDGELEQLFTDLEAGKDVEREPVYSITANSHGENDYGDSYVEINLTAQHLFVYKDGNLVVESDFVSGNISKGNGSPTGAFPLTYKTRDATLRGEDYETPVNYWMPFAGDVGMHDATWRRSFGGNIYKTGGSHGCINLPISVAKTIYETIDKGYAVLVYTLPGTESKAAQQQDAATVVNTINSIGLVTLESEPVIVSARNLYNALPDTGKALVTNYDVLTAAEAALAQLKGEAVAPAATDQTVAPEQTAAPEQIGAPEQIAAPEQTGAPETPEGQ